MTVIMFIESDGAKHVIDAADGLSVMEAALGAGVPGIDADCGGGCACATCHVYVDEAWLDRIPPRGDLETELLELAIDPRANSRLSCQIHVNGALDGLTLALPASQK